MSILPTSGIVVSAAGSPLAQAGGADRIRAQQAATAQQRQVESEIRAEDTAGIAATDGEDQETHDRDADGRTPWKFPAAPHAEAVADADVDANASPQPRTPHGESGGQLDLTG